MMFYPHEKLVLMVDGANLYSAVKALGFDLDYKAMRAYFASKGTLVRALYFTALFETDEFSPLRPLVDFLDYNGWQVETKPAKTFTDLQGNRRVKGDMDVDLAVAALEMAEHADHFILVTGDGDFFPLVEALQRRGKRVSVLSTIKSTPALCSDDLRRQADCFIELDTLKPHMTREQKKDKAA